jgi:hypothetical protein
MTSVYLLGAGINQAIQTHDRKMVLSPPLTNNFFAVARSLHVRFRDYDTLLKPLYDLILEYWHKTISDLEFGEFNLEDCFSFVQLQLLDAELDNDVDKTKQLYKIRYLLIAYFAEVMLEFRDYYQLSPVMLNFGKILHKEKATVITFNYDLFVEDILQNVNGSNGWKLEQSYNIKFDKIFGRQIFTPDTKLIFPSVLKLHGSLNWYRYINQTPNQFITSDKLREIYEPRKNHIILQNLNWFLPVSDTPWTEDQLFVEPITITPVIHKQFYAEGFLYKKVFDVLWKNARDSLSKCKSLVVIGYSFPPTDFHTRKLFLEAFSKNIVTKLVIVNPDPGAAERAKELVRHKETITLPNLGDYVRKYPTI